MFDWIKFITLARVLVKMGSQEAIRTAISRLYYGFFGVLRRYLINVKNKYYLKKRNVNVHHNVFEELYSSDDLTEYELSLVLNKLRNFRNIADYDDENHFDKKFFQDFLEDNKKYLLDAFDALNYLKNHPNY